jgi:hypothetical protein
VRGPWPSTWPSRVWGARPEEVARRWTCDGVHPEPTVRLLRAVDVAAPPSLVYAWLGNLRAAPYSYDLIDNRGHRSPRHLLGDLPPLAAGQPVLSLFTVVRSVPGQELTIGTEGGPAERWFGRVTMTYAVLPAPGGSRLVAVVLEGTGGGRAARVRGELLAWGDLVMIRKQLHTLRDLAERDAASGH